MERTLQAVLAGMLVMIAGTIPRNLLFAANLREWLENRLFPWSE